MANLLEICELVHRQLYPNGKDEAAISLAEMIATGKSELSYQSLLHYWQMKQQEGEYNIPDGIIQETEIEVIDNEADLSELKILKALPSSMWLINLGGLTCSCVYIKSNVNDAQILCEDDSLPDNYKPYIPVGNKLKFPKGAHKDKITMLYASNGENVPDRVEIDDYLGGLLRRSLIDIYKGRVPEDVTNNSNADK